MKSTVRVSSLLLLLLSTLAYGASPVPLVYQPLVPGTVAPGGSGFSLTVNGANFVTGAVVQWNGSTRVTQFVSASQLKANIRAADIATAGTASIQVLNPGTPRPQSNIVFFPISTVRTNLTFSSSALASDGNPNSLATGDFNHDGILDLAVCKDLTGRVSILLGTGGGAFVFSADYPTFGFCNALILGDFNGDHNLDVAVSNSSVVAVLLGRGDGRFQAGVPAPVGMMPEDLFAADFNADGLLDLAVANFASGSVSLLLGKGDGSFQPHVDYIVGDGVHGVTAADFDGDGKLDLAVAAERTNNVFILHGNGDGTFMTGVPFAGGVNSSFVSAADFNADGKLDLAVSDLNPLTYPLSTLLGNGDGTFQTRMGSPAMAYGVPQIADLNVDGKLDVVLTNTSGPAVLLGKGNGRFQAVLNFSTGSATAVTVGDFNNDGLLDLAVGGYSSQNIVILLQTSTGN